MIKLMLILFVALIFEAVGIVYLSRGLKQLSGEARPASLSELVRIIRVGVTNGNLWFGMLFEALFFFGLLLLMAKSDVSFIWPLTSLGFGFTTLAARFFLGEEVSGIRWGGVVLIIAGAALISYSEKVKTAGPPPPKALTEPE